MNEAKDILNQYIKVNDYLLYPCEICDSSILNFAQVIEVKDNKSIMVRTLSKWGRYDTNRCCMSPKKIKLSDTSKVVVIEKEKIPENIRKVFEKEK